MARNLPLRPIRHSEKGCILATIYDLIEVTGISENTTYTMAAGNVLGVVDGMTSTALNDGEFDIGDAIVIGGVSYSINRIQEPSNSSRYGLADGTDRSIDPGSESNLASVFLTVSNGTSVRYFIIPNDSYGDLTLDEVRTGSLIDVAASDSAIISTINNAVKFVCFVAGSMILTPNGEVAVEDIRQGDLVITRDHGAQSVRAILTKEIDLRRAQDRDKPVAFAAGSLGANRPSRQLCLSPQHRLLVADPSGNSVLVPAKSLVGRSGVRIMHGKRQVRYFHLVFERHEIIWANGTPTESFFPGPEALQAISEDDLEALSNLYGRDIRNAATALDTPAAPILKGQEARRANLVIGK